MNTASQTAQSSAPTASKHKQGYLFGPWVDFLGLGGASLICLAFLAIFADPAAAEPTMIVWFLILGNFINHPHFAHSYQIFYRDFKRKTGPETETILRYRYWFAGLIAPIALIGFYIFALMTGRVNWIGYSVNLMAFLVGWHYVKQGYGMLSVDSVLKRKFFTDGEKKLLLWNAYAGWLFSWMFINSRFAEGDFKGLSYYAFNIPEIALTGMAIVMAGFALVTIGMFARRMMEGGKGLPLNGVMAYVTSIYIWLIVAQLNPLFLIVIPAFHSLQYMTVVGRFQLNVENEAVASGVTTRLSAIVKSPALARLLRFYLMGTAIGFLAFFGVPYLVIMVTDFDPALFGTIAPLAVIWLFINIHHYLLDNVMWRKGNPDVGKHLFAHR